MIASAPLLAISSLTRRFGGVVAVQDVSFSVAPGEIFGLIGPNGAGKTTLFNVVTGLTPPSSGTVVFQGHDITRRTPNHIARRGIARTFQNIRLFGNLSALQNIVTARHIHMRTGALAGVLGLPGAMREEQQSRDKALELLNLIGLSARAEENAQNLSYGDQRRLEIARALAVEPKLLLLDEPAAGMNPNEKRALSDFIRRLRDSFHLTVLVIEHHVPLVMGLCDRVAVLNFGQLIALDDPVRVQNNRAVVEAYLGDETALVAAVSGSARPAA